MCAFIGKIISMRVETGATALAINIPVYWQTWRSIKSKASHTSIVFDGDTVFTRGLIVSSQLKGFVSAAMAAAAAAVAVTGTSPRVPAAVVTVQNDPARLEPAAVLLVTAALARGHGWAGVTGATPTKKPVSTYQ